ncbi:MAG: Flp family type IVb pilin [Bryobacteraceae bacterium]
MRALLGRLGLKGDKLKSVLRGLCRDDSGQDMIEYALMAATLAVVVAGFLPPAIMPAVSTIFSKITSTIAIS